MSTHGKVARPSVTVTSGGEKSIVVLIVRSCTRGVCAANADLEICRFADLQTWLQNFVLALVGPVSGPCVRGSPRVHSFRHSIPQKLKNEHSVAILCVAVMPTHDLDNLELH